MTTKKNGKQAEGLKQAGEVAVRIVLDAESGTYYAAIRDLASIVLKELDGAYYPTNDMQWGFYFALKQLVKDSLVHDENVAGAVSNEVLKRLAKNAEGTK